MNLIFGVKVCGWHRNKWKKFQVNQINNGFFIKVLYMSHCHCPSQCFKRWGVLIMIGGVLIMIGGVLKNNWGCVHPPAPLPKIHLWLVYFSFALQLNIFCLYYISGFFFFWGGGGGGEGDRQRMCGGREWGWGSLSLNPLSTSCLLVIKEIPLKLIWNNSHQKLKSPSICFNVS